MVNLDPDYSQNNLENEKQKKQETTDFTSLSFLKPNVKDYLDCLNQTVY